ncbi:hypothetical protein E4U42_005400 [Claviceps africana]|uniref:Uncharacterized protein n=1 Tax=Claviceps africana TaxID=83212 RepID=A0A8K0NHE5_9HYPO|nr:hypothetical protein E4U42_005400 [Claviceps africana]
MRFDGSHAGTRTRCVVANDDFAKSLQLDLSSPTSDLAPSKVDQSQQNPRKVRSTAMTVDKEHGLAVEQSPLSNTSSNENQTTDHVPATESPGFLARLRDFEARLDAKVGVEADAIARKRPEDKKHVSWSEELAMALIWASGSMNMTSLAIGFMGGQFGLSLQQAILITVFGSMLAAAMTASCAMLGPATGLRQLSISRYSFGWWPNKLITLLNCIQQVCWAAVNCITGGLTLTAVSDGRVSLAPSVVILAVTSLLISFLGLKAILLYERYAWIAVFVIYVILFARTCPYAENSAPSVTGASQSGALLNLLAIVYGASASWCVVASDYYVHYRANVSRVKVFLMTTFGIAIPTAFSVVAGVVAASALNNQSSWRDAYRDGGLGYVLQEMLYPRGLAKFLLTLLVLSGINGNVFGLYSASLSIQQLARPLALIPRSIWALVTFACITAMSIGGREKLNPLLENFLGLLGYWCTSYGVILLEEHFIFRTGRFENYDLEGWNDPARLPLGLGAAAAFVLGMVSWFMGMNQTWLRGPLANLIGSTGGDIGNELTLVVTALGYLPARYLELRHVGR